MFSKKMFNEYYIFTAYRLKILVSPFFYCFYLTIAFIVKTSPVTVWYLIRNCIRVHLLRTNITELSVHDNNTDIVIQSE